jgi:predicted Zn-dependent protease
MREYFFNLSDKIMSHLQNGEHLKLSFGAENSQFIRFNNAKIRQTGLVDDMSISIEYISNNRNMSCSITLTQNMDIDFENLSSEIESMRGQIQHLPEDPYIVYPENKGSSQESHSGSLLPIDKAADALTPAMHGVDLAGIWASGRVYVGNTNSAGQKHWFATDSFSLDYSLITPEEKMVKATFAGKNWDQSKYESFMADSVNKLKMMNQPAVKIDPGNYRTYIASAGVSDILHMFSWNGISEASIQQGQSAFGKMRSENIQLSSLFSISENFTHGSVQRFNGNGEIAPEKLSLIENGVLKNTLISTRTAKEYDKTSNFAGDGEYMRACEMKPGTLASNDVLQEIGTGIFLGNLHYLNWSDNIGGRITGMTRYACFWVENGEIVAPIENMRFDDSLYNIFGGNLEAVGDSLDFHPDIETYGGRELGGVHCPGILLTSFELTL